MDQGSLAPESPLSTPAPLPLNIKLLLYSTNSTSNYYITLVEHTVSEAKFSRFKAYFYP